MARRKFSREFEVLAKTMIVLRPVSRFFFRRAQPVIIELLALASYGHAARNR
jgi:hypothetical protein